MNIRSGLIAVLVFVLDRWSKHLVETRLAFESKVVVIPGFFDIVRSENSGVAFGLFTNAESPYKVWLLILFSVGALAMLAWLLWRNRGSEPYSQLAIALIFGGALGNVFDRIRFGSVTDFLDFYAGTYHWYTFNVADTSISIGAALLLLGMLRRGAVERKATA
jgi:signal peptidase II